MLGLVEEPKAAAPSRAPTAKKKAKASPAKAAARAPKKKSTPPPKPAAPQKSAKPARSKPAMASKKEGAANLAKGRAVAALVRTGMPKDEARKAVGLDDTGAARKPARKVHHTGETVVPTPDGSGIMSGRSGALRAYVHAHTVLQYDERELGAILEGMIRGIREPSGPDTSSMFPPSMNGPAMDQWKELAQERELGRQLIKHMGKALVHFNVSPDEWRNVFERSMREMFPDGRGVVVPFGQAPAAKSGADRGVWLSPLTIPSAVTDVFNRIRDDGTVHKGVDLRAAVGTLVVAPRRGRVAKVGFDEEGGGGRFIHLVIERPDGTVPMDEFGRDDSGWRMSFAHLSDVIVKEGEMVEAGQPIARSGDTGYRQSGPHLHMSLQWFIDNKAINERIFVDPLSVIPEEVIKGTAPPQRVLSGVDRIAPAVIEAQPGSKGGQSVSVSIGGDGNLIFSGGGTPVQVAPKANVPITLPIPFTGGGADDVLLGRATDFFGPGAAPPVRPMSAEGSAALMAPSAMGGATLQGIPEKLLSMGGKVLEGVGNFAGRAFQVLTSPQGVRGAGTLLGGATGLLGAASSVAGAALPAVGPLLMGWIPYVGPALAAASQVAGPILSAAGPVLGGVGGAVSAAAGAVPQGGPRSPAMTFEAEFFGRPNGKADRGVMPV